MNRFGISTWYSYPGRPLDRFTEHRGHTLISKSRNMVYCCQCSCGIQYIGQSFRNLKVRVSEHLLRNSRSAVSVHIRQNPGHFLATQNTVIIACEQNNLRRKLMESICFKRKAKMLCNTGLSLELLAIWNLCMDCVGKELQRID